MKQFVLCLRGRSPGLKLVYAREWHLRNKHVKIYKGQIGIRGNPSVFLQNTVNRFLSVTYPYGILQRLGLLPQAVKFVHVCGARVAGRAATTRVGGGIERLPPPAGERPRLRLRLHLRTATDLYRKRNTRNIMRPHAPCLGEHVKPSIPDCHRVDGDCRYYTTNPHGAPSGWLKTKPFISHKKIV
ncbi:hypothetical protein EVAR_29167_1 [Eumeta japonica]|uniref:Uncharacterized protein n=1 Tax=Eumeta variegata TaxID=151549 RepID=A0A4C1VCP0_EUMVA|nr:hypothetical protein EVAR_29167_1 [Eumeta japonica]